MKHKLKIEALRVESFAVSAEAAGERGTVRGFAKPTQGCQPTFDRSCMVADCYPTFEYSCGYPDTTCPR